MSKHMQITHADVQRALAKFMEDGGWIRMLPKSPDVRSFRVNVKPGTAMDLIERIRTMGYVASAE